MLEQGRDILTPNKDERRFNVLSTGLIYDVVNLKMTQRLLELCKNDKDGYIKNLIDAIEITNSIILIFNSILELNNNLKSKNIFGRRSKEDRREQKAGDTKEETRQIEEKRVEDRRKRSRRLFEQPLNCVDELETYLKLRTELKDKLKPLLTERIREIKMKISNREELTQEEKELMNKFKNMPKDLLL